MAINLTVTEDEAIELEANEQTGGIVAVDQTYNPASKNAQSGVAIAGALQSYQTIEGHDEDMVEIEGKITGFDSRVSAVEGKASTLVGDDAGKSAREIASEELAKELVPENAKDALDTIAEIAAWIQSHPDDASAMNAKIAANETAISGLETNQNTMQEDLTAIIAKVTTLVGGNAGKSAYEIAVLALTEALIPDGAKESLDTLQEIAQWIQDHPDDAAAMNEKITALETSLTALKSTVDTHATEIGDLSALTTTAKTDLVSAINEAAASGGSSGGDPNALAMLWGKDYDGNRTSTVSYNSDGNVSSISETGDGNTATRTYTYDSDGRIIKEAVTGTTPDGSYTKTKELTYGDNGATKVVETYSKTLSDPTWAEIAAKIKAGVADMAYNVGDLFTETWDHYTSASAHASYSAPWQYDGTETGELEDGSTQTIGRFEFKYCTPFYMQFDSPEAFYACEEALVAGSYYVTRGSTNYNFTLTKDIEAGGRIAFHSKTGSASTSSVDSYKADGKTPIETVACTTGDATGTSLGTFASNDNESGELNAWYCVMYGNGRYRDSAIRQWLNSDKASGEWWTPAHKWDIVPRSADIAMAGFLHGLPSEMVAAMKAVKTITYPYTGSTPDITYDKVTLHSWDQLYTTGEVSGENNPLTYYKNANGTSSRWSRGSSIGGRVKYRLDSHSSSSHYWLRSSNRGGAYSVWYVNYGGYGHGNGACNDGCRVVPLACIG